ncbi:hypothetical protein NFI96_000552 [Prochilodus magdalenae]|nr:hypothetical protein NFI96_000552 [Prochilodus magdalenae]
MMRGELVFRVYWILSAVRHIQGSRLRPDEEVPQIVHHPSDVVVRVGNPATLSCRAQGNPEPSIQWLRNGIPLEPEKMEVQSRPIILPEGSLFFLSVVPGRKSQSHEAVYACVARNSAGIATSRNASLHIAALRDEFRVQPNDVEVAMGEVAVMNCSPPVGHPEPNISWRKDGVLINITDDHYMFSALFFEKPVLLREPQDVSVRLGESAQFYCEAQGDPMPTVEWSREQGPLPNGRYLVNPDQSLQIHYVTLQDAGRYTCTAANDVGVATASAQLFVEDAGSSSQRELHKELSALRVSLENITVLRNASNVAQVMWKLQSSPSQPHYLEGFEVLYRSLLPASSEWAAQKVPQPALQTQVGPLKRGYKYEFKVRPYGSDLYGRESNTRHLRVPETVPSAPPQEVSIMMPTDRNDTAHLSWLPPPHVAHNGIIQGYQVWCLQEEDQQYLNWTVDSGTHSLEISPLQPGKHYGLRVAAVNGAGIGAQSSPYKFLIGLYRLASEDLIIKHRMAAPDSPWISGAWKPDSSGDQYQSLWTQSNQEIQGLKRTTLPITDKSDSSPLEAAVPIVPDNCGVYGTFYVDLSGDSLKTFNSPARRPKMPHSSTQQHQNSETIRITQPVAKAPLSREMQVLPWKRALPSQPNMGVRKESWEKNCKRGGASENMKPFGSPRILHYSASLHLVDMLPSPPPLPMEDNQSVSSEEGSSRSTKLTVDVGSLQSVCAASTLQGPGTVATGCPSQRSPSYSHLSTASFCLSTDDHQDSTLSTQSHEYLELSPKPHRRSALSEKPPSLTRPFSPTPTFGYICGPSEREVADVDDDDSQSVGLRSAALRSTPSSCCSDWEGSLWNGWGSVSEGNMQSARTSIISSSDGSFMNDANFARVLAMTAESMNGTLSGKT